MSSWGIFIVKEVVVAKDVHYESSREWARSTSELGDDS